MDDGKNDENGDGEDGEDDGDSDGKGNERRRRRRMVIIRVMVTITRAVNSYRARTCSKCFTSVTPYSRLLTTDAPPAPM